MHFWHLWVRIGADLSGVHPLPPGEGEPGCGRGRLSRLRCMRKRALQQPKRGHCLPRLRPGLIFKLGLFRLCPVPPGLGGAPGERGQRRDCLRALRAWQLCSRRGQRAVHALPARPVRGCAEFHIMRAMPRRVRPPPPSDAPPTSHPPSRTHFITPLPKPCPPTPTQVFRKRGWQHEHGQLQWLPCRLFWSLHGADIVRLHPVWQRNFQPHPRLLLCFRLPRLRRGNCRDAVGLCFLRAMRQWPLFCSRWCILLVLSRRKIWNAHGGHQPDRRVQPLSNWLIRPHARVH